jgi:hypothetical protein
MRQLARSRRDLHEQWSGVLEREGDVRPHWSGEAVRQPDGLTSWPGRGRDPASSPREVLRRLHRTLGNRHVDGLIQAGQVVGPPQDVYEQKADRVADELMRASRPETSEASRRPTRIASPLTPLASAQDGAPASGHLQASSAADAGGSAIPDVSGASDSMQGGGQPLTHAERSFFEPRLGVDLTEVRLHTNARAAQTARELNARAFTVGHDVAFGAGEYVRESPEGRRLLAHELAHVVQQRGDRRRVQREVDQAALDQCIAELGGSTRYRDASLPSAEELESYRQECLRRQGEAASARAIENLRRAWGYARERLGPETVAQVEHLFSPVSLAAMAAFALLYVAAQFTPVGWVADAIAILLLATTVIFVGALVIQIVGDLYEFFSAVDATTEDELREAGHALARALVAGGIGIFIALLTRGARGVVGRPPPTAPATAMVEVVAVGGGRMRIPASFATVEEAVQASRLQGLASYAVMVPPPGGTEPSSPASSAQAGARGGETTAEGARPSGGSGLGAAGGFSLRRIGYGEGALSRLAQTMRVMLNLRRGGNVAVFEFESVPARFHGFVARLGGRNVIVDGNRMAVQNVNGSAHSEQLAHQLITAARRAGMELNVRRIYTEYNPCTDTCLPLIRRQYPSAEVTYSFIWELWGRQTPDRNAAVEALFAGGRSGGGP